jgi:hypothetical protein
LFGRGHRFSFRWGLHTSHTSTDADCLNFLAIKIINKPIFVVLPVRARACPGKFRNFVITDRRTFPPFVQLTSLLQT